MVLALLSVGCASLQREQVADEQIAQEQQADAYCQAPADAAAASWCNHREHEQDRAIMRESLQAQQDEHRAAEKERRRQRAMDVWKASQAPFQAQPWRTV